MTEGPEPSRVVVVTGAGGALGAAVSQRLASEPGTALVLSDLSEESLAETLVGVAAHPAPTESMLADVSDPDQVEAVVARAVERFGRLDVLISNAGVLSANGRIHNLPTEEWERAFRVNVLGSVNGIRAAVGVMRPRRSGSIVLTASIAGLTAWSHSGPYCATKAAVIQLAKVAAVEYAATGSGSTACARGRSARPSTPGFPKKRSTPSLHATRWGSARPPISRVCTRISPSDDSRWTTGSALVVDGGYSAP